MKSMEQQTNADTRQPTLRQLTLYFLRLGATGFGGPYALIALMRRDLVERTSWFREEQFEEGFAFSQTAPGPVAPQLAMYLAQLRFGPWGALLSVIAFIAVPFILIIALAALYVSYGSLPWLRALLYGISPVIVALIAHAAFSLGRNLLRSSLSVLIATLSFLAVIFAQIDLSIIILSAGLFGVLGAVAWRDRLSGLSPFPILGVLQTLTATWTELSTSLLPKLSWFFLKAGALTFGSGYVVVAFLQKGIVDDYGWLTQQQFLDAVAAGQITPGPVVITSTFVGYLIDGPIGAIVSTVSVFLPVFLITILLAPVIARHRSNPMLRGFMTMTNASAIGVIAGVSVLMGQSAVVDWQTSFFFLASLVALVLWNTPSLILIAICAILGLLVSFS